MASRIGLFSSLITALAVLVLVIFLLTRGYVSGVEFNPDNFSRRQFSYNRMPVFRIPVLGIKYDDVTPLFEQTLLNDGLVGGGSAVNRWDLVSDNCSQPESPDFDARYLCRILDLTKADDGSDPIWSDWNSAHPDRAVRLWPFINELAREGLYLDASKILLWAYQDVEIDSLQFLTELDLAAADAFRRFGSRLLSSGELELAIVKLTRSIEVSPSSAAYRTRAQCYQRLGNEALRRADEAAADSLGDNEQTE
jgi:tetratricopeptide (TPR) repeat protein